MKKSHSSDSIVELYKKTPAQPAIAVSNNYSMLMSAVLEAIQQRNWDSLNRSLDCGEPMRSLASSCIEDVLGDMISNLCIEYYNSINEILENCGILFDEIEELVENAIEKHTNLKQPSHVEFLLVTFAEVLPEYCSAEVLEDGLKLVEENGNTEIRKLFPAHNPNEVKELLNGLLKVVTEASEPLKHTHKFLASLQAHKIINNPENSKERCGQIIQEKIKDYPNAKIPSNHLLFHAFNFAEHALQLYYLLGAPHEEPKPQNPTTGNLDVIARQLSWNYNLTPKSMDDDNILKPFENIIRASLATCCQLIELYVDRNTFRQALPKVHGFLGADERTRALLESAHNINKSLYTLIEALQDIPPIAAQIQRLAENNKPTDHSGSWQSRIESEAVHSPSL